MDKLFSRFEPFGYALFRITFGLLFLFHGLQKIFGAYGGRVVELASLRGIAGIIELLAGTLIMMGLFTRAAAFIASGQMAVAYFLVHQPQGFWPIENKGELAALYCFAFLYIAARGNGQWDVLLQKRRVVAALVLMAIVAIPTATGAQQLTPKIKVGKGTLDFHGWAHSIYDNASDKTAESVRLRVRLTKPRGLGAFGDLDLLNLTKQGGIKRVALTYNVTANWQFLAGRFPVAPFYFAPSDIALETVQYARTPFSYFASGIQTSYKSKSGWSLIADITGNSSKRAYDRTQFDRVEFSARLTQPVGKAALTETVQLSSEFQRVGLDIAHAPAKKFRYRMLGYAGRTKGVLTTGGHVLAVYQIRPWLEQHNQLDVRRQERRGLDPIILTGVRMKTKPEWVLLTLEHQFYPDRVRKRNFFIRAQVHF